MEGCMCTWILIFSVLVTCNCSNGIGVMDKRMRRLNKKLNNFKIELVQMDTDLHDSIDIAKESLRLDLTQVIKQQIDEAMTEFRESESVPEVGNPHVVSEIQRLKQGHRHMKRQLHSVMKSLRDVQQWKDMYRDAFIKAKRSMAEACSMCDTKLLSRVLKQCKRRVVQNNPANEHFFKERNNMTSDLKKLSNCKQEIEKMTSTSISSTTTTIFPPTTSTPVELTPVMNRLIIGHRWTSELSQINLESNSLTKYPLHVSGGAYSLCFLQRLRRLLVGTWITGKIMSTTLDGDDIRTLREEVSVLGMAVDEEKKLVFMTTWRPWHSISSMTTRGDNFTIIRNLTGEYDFPFSIAVNPRERVIYAVSNSRMLKLNYYGKALRILASGKMFGASFDNVRNMLYFNDGKTLKKMSMSDEVITDVTTLSIKPFTLSYYNNTVYYGGLRGTRYVGAVQLDIRFMMEGPLVDVNKNQECFLQQPGEVIRPVVGEGQVGEITLRLYCLKVTAINELNSYNDRNYHIKVSQEHSNPGIKEISDLGFVVKIMNSKDSKNIPFFEAQHALMSCLARSNIPAQVPLPNMKGGYYSLETIYPEKDKKGSPGQYMFELRTFLPGQIIQSVPYTTDLLRQDGELVANVLIALKKLDNAYFKSVDPTYRLRTLTNVPNLTKYTFCLDGTNRTIVDDIISTFTERVVSRLHQLPKGLIYGDINEQNILVNKKPEGSECNISGLLDYTDAEFTYPVFDLAVNLAYMMIDSNQVDQLDTPGYILSGYLSVRTLTSSEWEVLVPCVAGRLAQSLTLGAHANYVEPENSYVLTTAKKGWPLLHKFWAESESSLISRWKAIIESKMVLTSRI